MTIHTWVFVLILFAFALIAIGSLTVATRTSLHLEEEQNKNRQLTAENKELTRALAHRNALDNIKAANDYYNQREQGNV